MGSDGSRLPSAITTSDCMPSHKKTTKTQNTNALTKASDQRQSRKLMATDYIDFQGTKGVPRRDQMCLMTTLRPQPWYDDVGCRQFPSSVALQLHCNPQQGTGSARRPPAPLWRRVSGLGVWPWTPAANLCTLDPPESVTDHYRWPPSMAFLHSLQILAIRCL